MKHTEWTHTNSKKYVQRVIWSLNNSLNVFYSNERAKKRCSRVITKNSFSPQFFSISLRCKNSTYYGDNVSEWYYGRQWNNEKKSLNNIICNGKSWKLNKQFTIFFFFWKINLLDSMVIFPPICANITREKKKSGWIELKGLVHEFETKIAVFRSRWIYRIKQSNRIYNGHLFVIYSGRKLKFHATT